MKRNRTTQRTVEILRLVSKKQDGITLDEICDQLTIPKTSAYDIVTTLAEMEMLKISKGQKQSYTIGLMAYRIGVNYVNHMDFISLIEPELKSFSREVGKTVFFGVQSGHDIVYLYKSEPENPIITTATVGSKNPMYCTSLGKAILAFTDGEEKDQVLEKTKFRPKTKQTIVTREALEHELGQIKDQGYAIDNREVEEHMKCVGAPVFGPDGGILGAISASGLYKKDEDYDALGRTVAKKASDLSKMLGFLGKR